MLNTNVNYYYNKSVFKYKYLPFVLNTLESAFLIKNV